MPMYEYKCKECDRKFEELVGSAQAAIACPDCGSEKTEKLLSVFAASMGSNHTNDACPRPGCDSGFS
jgi:putative FmdB family regulatory protein